MSSHTRRRERRALQEGKGNEQTQPLGSPDYEKPETSQQTLGHEGRYSSRVCRKGPNQFGPDVVGTVIIYTYISILIKYV